MLRAIVLGAVQGLTEFIPVSSSGHLVLVPFVLGWEAGTGFTPDVPFDVAVHLGTALAVIAYFRRELLQMVAGAFRTALRRPAEGDRASGRLLWLLIVGSIPAAVVGLAFEGFFEGLFADPPVAALLLLVTAGLLVVGEALHRRAPAERREIDDLRVTDALLVGAFQAVAIAPGISRSATTIVGGLARRMSRETAARFSFLLGLPAILGAGIVQLPDFPARTEWGNVVAGTGAAAALGFASIWFLLRYLRRGSLHPFAAYCVAAAGFALVWWRVA